MVIEYGDEWPETFAKWMQEVLIDSRSNAFSIFVYEETCRVFDGAAALQIPRGDQLSRSIVINCSDHAS